MKFSIAKKFLLVALKLAFMMLAFYLVFSKIELTGLLLHLENLNMPLFFLALTLQVVSMVGSALRSRYYLGRYGLKITRSFAVRYYFVGTLFNVILPGGIGGDGYKVYLLWKHEKFPKLKGLRVMLYERVNGFYPLAFLGLVFIVPSGFNNLFPYQFYLVCACIILITPCYLFGVKYILRDQIPIALNASKYSLTVQLLQVLSAIVVLKALMPEASLQENIDYIFLFVFATIMAILPISIGGAGLRELTFLYGLQLIPTGNPETGVAFALLNFFLYLLTAMLGIPLFYSINKWKA